MEFLNDPFFILGLCSLAGYLLIAIASGAILYYGGRLLWVGVDSFKFYAAKMKGEYQG